MTITAYPLHWPDGWKWTVAARRKRASFGSSGSAAAREKLTISAGTRRVLDSLRRFGARQRDIIISTNLTLRLDGLPYSNQREPLDPGVSVYWRDSRQSGWPMRCIAVDLYDRVADNLAAIAAALEAMRAIERHGGAEILDRAFTGFTALPGPTSTAWHDVLRVPAHASTNDVRAAYRAARSASHPDRHGGDADTFRAIQGAWAAFCNERGISE